MVTPTNINQFTFSTVVDCSAHFPASCQILLHSIQYSCCMLRKHSSVDLSIHIHARTHARTYAHRCRQTVMDTQTYTAWRTSQFSSSLGWPSFLSWSLFSFSSPRPPRTSLHLSAFLWLRLHFSSWGRWHVDLLVTHTEDIIPWWLVTLHSLMLELFILQMVNSSNMATTRTQ